MRIALAALAFIASTAAVPQPAPVTGRWLTQGGKALIDVAPCGTSICGRIARILVARPGGPVVDANNPDVALRSRPILGLAILSGFAPKRDHWAGRIYDPESGRSYRSELRVADGVLKVKGCYGPFCRTQDWKRSR